MKEGIHNNEKNNEKKHHRDSYCLLQHFYQQQLFLQIRQSSKTVEAPKMAQTQQCETNGSFKSHLDSLVASGTLDQDKEDAIQSAGQKDDSNKGNHYGEFNRGYHKGQIKHILDGLVKAGTITQAQEDAIQSAMSPTKEATPVKSRYENCYGGSRQRRYNYPGTTRQN